MILCRFTNCSNDEMIHHINQVGKLNILGIDHSAMFVPNNDLHQPCHKPCKRCRRIRQDNSHQNREFYLCI